MGHSHLLFHGLLLSVGSHLVHQPVHHVRLGDAVQLFLDGVILLAGLFGVKAA